jgi:hypothetical protein
MNRPLLSASLPTTEMTGKIVTKARLHGNFRTTYYLGLIMRRGKSLDFCNVAITVFCIDCVRAAVNLLQNQEKINHESVLYNISCTL